MAKNNPSTHAALSPAKRRLFIAPTARLGWQAGTATVQVPAWRGFRYELRGKSALTDPEWNPLTDRTTPDPWTVLDLPDTTPATSKFYRVHID